MQVQRFIAIVKDEIWPESLHELIQCKTTADTNLWRTHFIEAITKLELFIVDNRNEKTVCEEFVNSKEELLQSLTELTVNDDFSMANLNGKVQAKGIYTRD